MGAKAIIEALEQDGWAEVERMIGAREPETVHLDFKRIEGGVSTPLGDEDLGHVAKAVSAFANIEGGVLLLGVNAKGRGKEPDRADGVIHIEKVDAAAAQLERFAPTLTDPPVPGLRVRPIEDPNRPKAGVVAIYAPQSDGGPHQAARGDGKARYFMRTATNSEPMPHSILAGMFGRRPQPKLRLAVAREGGGAGSVYIRNHGRGLARDVLVRITISDVHQPQIFGALAHTEGWPRSTPARFRGAPIYAFVLKGQSPVHGLDTAKIGVFGQQDADARIFVSARIDAEGVEPVLIRTAVRLNGGHVVDVPVVGEAGHDEIDEPIE